MSSKNQPKASNNAASVNEDVATISSEPPKSVSVGSKSTGARALILLFWIVAIAGCIVMLYPRFTRIVDASHVYLYAGVAVSATGCVGLLITSFIFRDKPVQTITATGILEETNVAETLDAQPTETVPQLSDAAAVVQPEAAVDESHDEEPVPTSAGPTTITLHGHVWVEPKIEIVSQVNSERSDEAVNETLPTVQPSLRPLPEPETFTFAKNMQMGGGPTIDGLGSFGKSDPLAVHTLVTLSVRNKHLTGESASDSPETEVDAVLFDRLDEYKLFKPDEGCVLLITQTGQPHGESNALVPRLNGATAALNLARTAASVHGLSTLIIDAGSLAWSKFSPSDWTTGPAPDVVDLPRVPGVFDILAGKSDFDDWLLVDDETPNLSALAPGEIPADWQAALQSDAMRDLITKARKEADVIIIYAPNVQDHSETVKALGALSNGILLVTGSGADGAADELAALEMLPEGSVILGRIALGDEDISNAEPGAEVNTVTRNPQASLFDEPLKETVPKPIARRPRSRHSKAEKAAIEMSVPIVDSTPKPKRQRRRSKTTV